MFGGVLYYTRSMIEKTANFEDQMPLWQDIVGPCLPQHSAPCLKSSQDCKLTDLLTSLALPLVLSPPQNPI